MSSKSDFRRLVQQEGVPAAYQGLMRVLQDPRASATALASASRTMLEVAGMLKVSEDTGAKEPHEMTAAELQAKIAELRRAGREAIVPRPSPFDQAEPSNGVFS